MAFRYFDPSAHAYAHRGLWTRTRPENSLSAFLAAAATGVGVELDVRLTADGEPVVFHDRSLQRMCGVLGCIDATTWNDVATLRLPDGSTPPHLLDVLDVLRQVPVLIEMKVDNPGDTRIADVVSSRVADRDQLIALMSFDADTVRALRRANREFPVGLLVDAPERIGAANVGALAQLAARIGCDFLGPNTAMLGDLQDYSGALVTWTIRDPTMLQEAIAHQAAPIFEGFEPALAQMAVDSMTSMREAEAHGR